MKNLTVDDCFDEEKIILRYCPFIEERFGILYQVRCQDFNGGLKRGGELKVIKKGIIMSLTNEVN